MPATGQVLVDSVNENIGNRTDKATALLRAVNATIKRIASYPTHTFRTLEQLSQITGDTTNRSYALPTRTGSVLTVFIVDANGDNQKLIQLSVEMGERLVLDGTIRDGARPSFYWIFGTNIFLDAIPDQVYTINVRFRQKPIDVTLASRHTYDDELDEVIIAGGTARMFRQLQEPEDSREWERDYIVLLREAASAERLQPDWVPSKRRSLEPIMGHGFLDPVDPFAGRR